MAIVSIATSTTDTHYDQVTVLDGREYLLRFAWNAADESWMLGIYDQDENPLALGLVIVVGEPLTSHLTNPKLPPGVLMCVDLTGEDRDPGVDELGTRCRLLYREAGE